MGVPQGTVTRALSGFYDVTDKQRVIRCRARGVFRKRGTTVLVGDEVSYEPVGTTEGIITEVFPRRTELVRPPVANVDLAVLVFSLQSPAFHTHLLDKTLVCAEAAGVRSCVVITKVDLGTEDELERAMHPYINAGYPVIPVSVVNQRGIQEFHEQIRGRVSVFVGPSGAGKSSLGNTLSSELGLKMGEVSEKLGRGKHTTRHVELFRVFEETFVADAPGFSQLDVPVASTELRRYFPEFQIPSEFCGYRGCAHVDEDDCGVRRAAEQHEIPHSRYENYLSLYEELKHKEDTRY